MKYRPNRLFLLLLCVAVLTLPVTAYAASVGAYRPPAITVIVRHASLGVDMNVTINRQTTGELPLPMEKESRLWETDFRLFRYKVYGVKEWFGNAYDFKDAYFTVQDRGQTYTIPVPYDQLKKTDFNDVLILDLRTQQVTVGVSTIRHVAIFMMHLCLFLLLEAFVFWRCHINEKKNWIIFLIYTTLTKSVACFIIHGWLNIDPRVVTVYTFMCCFYIVIDLLFFLLTMDDFREKISKASVLANILSLSAVYYATKFLPM